MPLPGPRPKPRDQIRHRIPPAHEWTEVPDTPYLRGPGLPRSPARRPLAAPPEPDRLLGAPGRRLWDRAWTESYLRPDAEALLLLCELTDERVALRVRVLTDGDWRERQALRELDRQISSGLRALGLADANSAPTVWPPATRRWWKALSQMPHCVLWGEPEWQFALDTAQLVAAFHLGDLRLAQEIRTRERLMGTSPDARRALRIRYVDPSGNERDDEATASVTAMDTYRRMVTEE